jgi:hypothetical protein
MQIKKLFTLSLLLFNLFYLVAQNNQEQSFIIKLKPKPWGANLMIGYKDLSLIRGLDTILWAGGGAFWEQAPFYRNIDDELLTVNNIGDLDLKQDLFYERLNINWVAGISQGICWNKQLDENLLDISFFYKGRYDQHFEDDTKEQVLFNQNQLLPDVYGIQQHAFISGFTLNLLANNTQSNVKEGSWAETSIEWAPVFINNTADYIRFNTTLKNFIKIFSLPLEAENYFNLYWGNMLIFDLIDGASIPINIRQSVGGIQQQRLALGNGVIRGVDKGRYDANLKLAECSELRMILPINLLNEIVPGIMCFFDSAYYDQLKGASGGFIFSTGGGAFIDLFDKLQLTYYMSCFLNDKNLNDEQWSFFNLAFKLHF